MISESAFLSGTYHRNGSHHSKILFGATLVLVISLAVVAGPWCSGYQFDRQDFSQLNQPPGWEHWFGTDELGRDVLVRCLVGGRISLQVGLIATLVSVVIGVLYGAIAGYAGGRLDALLMRTVDVLYALPFIFVVIVLFSFFGNDLWLLYAALGAISWLTMARIVRGQVLSLKTQPFVEAAVALGASPARIVFFHLVPNVLGTVLVYSTLTIPTVMLEESFLSFLGLGVRPPMASWGTLVSAGVPALAVYPWQVLFPGLLMTVTLIGLNLLGEGLRDALAVTEQKIS
ncbi:MAG: ABC transporter permease [Blastocatellia bacterium]|nr:ABC transporter permease [Blastocatellia bacterium]